MKRRLLGITLTLMAATACAASPVYDDYANYYAALPGALFDAKQRNEVQPYSLTAEIRYGWKGKANGKQQRIWLDDDAITLNGQRLPKSNARIFPAEHVSELDLGRGTQIYFGKGYVCLENIPRTASGSAVRHMSIYLIQLGTSPVMYKLPSLFASCLGVRRVDNDIAFFDAQYHWLPPNEQPDGVVLTEYRLHKGAFVKTPVRRFARFVEPGNVYRFTITTLPEAAPPP